MTRAYWISFCGRGPWRNLFNHLQVYMLIPVRQVIWMTSRMIVDPVLDKMVTRTEMEFLKTNMEAVKRTQRGRHQIIPLKIKKDTNKSALRLDGTIYKCLRYKAADHGVFYLPLIKAKRCDSSHEKISWKWKWVGHAYQHGPPSTWYPMLC